MRILTDTLWKLQCRWNRRLPVGPEPVPPTQFVPRGASCDPLAGCVPTQAPPALCVVITTHARVEPCRQLLEALDDRLLQAGLHERAFVLVLEDPSEHEYGPVVDLLDQRFPERFAFYTARRKLGKAGRWFGYQTAFDVVRALRPEMTLFLEDDAVLSPDFVRDALARWHEIDDPKRTVLYLCRFDDDEPMGRWIRFPRTSLPEGRVQLTQWFDLHAFLVDERFFACLDNRLFRPWPSRWQGNPSRSSGVSEQFTLRLFGRGNIYQVCETLAFHGQAPSVLNAEARGRRPLDNHPRSPAGADQSSTCTASHDSTGQTPPANANTQDSHETSCPSAPAAPTTRSGCATRRLLLWFFGMLAVSALGLPAQAGRVASFLADLAVIGLGLPLALHATRRCFAPMTKLRALRVAAALLVALAVGQVLRNKKLFPLMPYTMYARAHEGPVEVYQYEALHHSGARSRFRPSTTISTLGYARIVKGLERSIKDITASAAVEEDARAERDLLSQTLRALMTHHNRAQADDPIMRVEVVHVVVPPPYRANEAQRRTLMTVSMESSP